MQWRDGIDAASGEIVALTISQMIPAPNWIQALREQQRTFDAVGGAIDPAPGLRLVDWAEYFCRYSRDMRPLRRAIMSTSRRTTPRTSEMHSSRSARRLARASGSRSPIRR